MVDTDVIARKVADELDRAARDGDRVRGVLFHSTAEPIEGPLHGDGLGMLWTAADPYISCQYIPNAGSEIILWKPDSWELDSKVPPGRDSTYYELACMLTQSRCEDVSWGRSGRAESWRYPRNWITYREVQSFIEDELGYQPNDNGVYYLRQHFDGEQFQIMKADWQMEGQVFMALSEGLRFLDIRRTSEPDLMEKEYFDEAAFDMAEREGYDGVIINDHAQADGYGNVPHLSYGLNRSGLEKLEWVCAPARRRHLSEAWGGATVTPELLEWADAHLLAGHPAIR